MQKKDTRRLWLRRLLKIHTIALTVTLGVYFLLAFLDPGLFSYDMRQKFQALADDMIVTATVLGPPQTPLVTATSECDESTGTLSVLLDWGDDPNTYTYDVDRDSLPLVSGLTASTYRDTNVTVATAYQYVVTANGPMSPGSASSAPVSLTTLADCEITAATPDVDIISVSGKNIQGEHDKPAVRNRRPLFTGVTNIANARIDLLVESDPYYTATVYANANGYWEWQQPVKLSEGEHTITVTAIDPNDSARRATAILPFRIKDNPEEPDVPAPLIPVAETQPEKKRPKFEKPFLDFTLSVKNPDAVVAQGEELIVGIKIQEVTKEHADSTVRVRYSISDENRNAVTSSTRDLFIREGREVRESLSIPLYMTARKYSVTAEILFEEMNISREVTFLVVDLPLLRLSTGETITYADFVRNIGWIVFLFFFLLFFWLFLLIREFAYYIHGHGKITERDLNRAGYFKR